jgi:hypothetical protein
LVRRQIFLPGRLSTQISFCPRDGVHQTDLIFSATLTLRRRLAEFSTFDPIAIEPRDLTEQLAPRV